MSSRVTADHEAAQPIVNYRAAGPIWRRCLDHRPTRSGVLGSTDDEVSDCFSSEHMEGRIQGRILSCYAGGMRNVSFGILRRSPRF